MPWELASGQRELGHHLGPASGARAGWTGTPSWSAAGFEAMGCRTDAEAGAARGLAGRPGG